MKNLFFAFAFLFSAAFMTSAANEIQTVDTQVSTTIEEDDTCVLIIETETEILIAVFEC